jgi:hypothetical protein
VSQKTLFGIQNVCFYASPDGEARYYLTRKSRDVALAALRDLAVSRGLAVAAARAGIYAVKRVVRVERDVALAEALIESASENERELAAVTEVAS